MGLLFDPPGHVRLPIADAVTREPAPVRVVRRESDGRATR
jgi:hypothetical protein